jgi:hypothetical protein
MVDTTTGERIATRFHAPVSPHALPNTVVASILKVGTHFATVDSSHGAVALYVTGTEVLETPWVVVRFAEDARHTVSGIASVVVGVNAKMTPCFGVRNCWRG